MPGYPLPTRNRTLRPNSTSSGTTATVWAGRSVSEYVNIVWARDLRSRKQWHQLIKCPSIVAEILRRASRYRHDDPPFHNKRIG